MIQLTVRWVEKPVHRLFCILGPGSQTQADAIGMEYDLAVEIALSAPPRLYNSTAKFARKCLLLVFLGQGLDTGRKSSKCDSEPFSTEV